MSALSRCRLARAALLATLTTTAVASCADELTLGEDAEAVLLSPTEKLSVRAPATSATPAGGRSPCPRTAGSW